MNVNYGTRRCCLEPEIEAAALTAAVTRSKKFATNWFSFVVLHEPPKKVIEYRETKTQKKSFQKIQLLCNWLESFFWATNNWICQFLFDASEGKIKIVITICDYINLYVSVSFYVMEKIKHNGEWILGWF